MMSARAQEQSGHRLLQFGIVLFLLGLLTGLVVPAVANPRMALAAHLEGLMNGLFLLALGLIWPRLRLSARTVTVTFWLAIYASLANFVATLLAAVLPAGSALMPLAGQGHTGTEMQELFLKVLLVSLSIFMIALCVLVLFGLRRGSSSDLPVDRADHVEGRP
jgi:(hydroxyamino)benzene mutase